ncbi:MAG: hypothetical protein AB7I19_11015 [Planctomycetota bacterium]
MSEFLLLVGRTAATRARFERGVELAAASGAGTPAAVLDREPFRLATFARRNGSGGRLAIDDTHWLMGAGTWFGPDNLAAGQERQLLDRAIHLPRRDFAATLDGFFAVLYGDHTNATLVTDPIGSHHVYVRAFADCVAFAASASWLAALEDTPLDPVGCQEFLATGVLYGDRTLHRDVHALPPASVVAIDEVGWRVLDRTWRVRDLAPERLSGAEAVEAFGAAMIRGCRRIGRTLPNVVADLTAGWDSRLLCAFLRRAEVPFETTVTGPAESADVVLSTRIADELGIRHHPLPLGALPTFEELCATVDLTDGQVNALGYARVLRVHRELSRHFGASLNGSFGEVARGYWWELLSPSPSAVQHLDATTIARRRYAANAPNFDFWPQASRLDSVAHFRDLIASLDSELTAAPLAFRLDRTYLRMRMRCWQGRIASATDRVWPCFSPLMLREALEPLLQTKAADRRENRFAREVLARYSPELARLPLESGGPAMPKTMTNAWRFAPEAIRFTKKVFDKLLGRRTYARTLEETAAPRRSLWKDDRMRDLLDPSRMALGDHVDRTALARWLDASREEAFPHELAFGNLVALELGLRRVRELRVSDARSR